jgi:hypothetical protein
MNMLTACVFTTLMPVVCGYMKKEVVESQPVRGKKKISVCVPVLV